MFKYRLLTMNIIRKYINMLIETLNDNKKLIAICLALYILIIIVSYIFSYNTIVSHMDAFNAQMMPRVNTTTISTTHIGPLGLFINNSLTVIYSYIGGILFGILPLFNILYNAIAVGSQIATFGFLLPNGSLSYIIYLIPHGIFEIPGSVIGSVSGFILFKFIWRLLKDLKQSDMNGFKERISDSYQKNKPIFIQSLILLIFGIILMMIAAPLESYVSPAFRDLLVPL